MLIKICTCLSLAITLEDADGSDYVHTFYDLLRRFGLRFADDVIEASDGSLYFSVASTKFGFHDWFLDILEARPHGQLLRYEPSSNRTTLVLDNLGFANGVAISKDKDFVVVCETWRFRCLKHWLTGDNEGKTQVFVENLPGAPDNINLAPDGSFWISLLQVNRKNVSPLINLRSRLRCN